jgi:hypothetical protein
MKNLAVFLLRNRPIGVLIAAACGATIFLWLSTISFASIVSGNFSYASSTQPTATTLTINKPTSSTDDVLLATIAIHGGSEAPVSGVPSGWTLIASTTNGANLTLLSYWKKDTGSEPSNYTWTVVGSTFAGGAITAYSGVDPENPVNVVSDSYGFSTTAITAPATTTAASTTVVAVFAVDEGKSSNQDAYFSQPTGMTEKFDKTKTSLGPSIALDEATQASAGTFESVSSSISGGGNSKNWATQVIALRRPLIHFDNNSSNYTLTSGSSLTTSHTVGGNNRILFVSLTLWVAGNPANADVISGVSFNGAQMTQVGKAATHLTENPLETYLYCLVAPDTGTHDIVASTTGSVAGIWEASASYTGAAQTCTPDALATNAGDSSSVTGTVTTVADNDWVIMGSYLGDGVGSAGSGTTIRAISPTPQNRESVSDNGSGKSPAGSVTLTVNGSNSDHMGSVTAAIAPAE